MQSVRNRDEYVQPEEGGSEGARGDEVDLERDGRNENCPFLSDNTINSNGSSHSHTCCHKLCIVLLVPAIITFIVILVIHIKCLIRRGASECPWGD